MSFESLKHEAVGKFLSAFPASLESLKREALKAFQCASTVKAVLKNTGMLAGAALADILETVRRFFTSLRFVQNDNTLTSFAPFSMTFQCDSTVKV